MSSQNSNFSQTKKKLKITQLEGSIPLVINKKILDKIKFLCSRIAKVEWSGLLFYTVRGSIKNHKRMSIIIEDIFLMDKGTSAYTEFDWNEDVVNYRMTNLAAMDWHVGHVHSHNTMGVFFSGTDMDELNDNCVNHNYYVSLIVNNFMEMTAKIAFTAESKPRRQIFECLDEEGKPYSMILEIEESEIQMFIFNCEVKKPVDNIIVAEDFAARLDAIEEKAVLKAKKIAEASKQATAQKQLNNSSGYSGYSYSASPKQQQQTKQIANKDIVNNWGNFMPDNIVTTSLEELFLCFIMRLGFQVKEDTLMDVLMDIEAEMLTTKPLILSIKDNFIEYYDVYFKNIPKYYPIEQQIKVLQTIAFMLDKESEEYEIARELSIVLKEIKVEAEDQLKMETLNENPNVI